MTDLIDETSLAAVCATKQGAPLSDWETKEAARVAALELMFSSITTCGFTANNETWQICERISIIEHLPQGSEWDEFEERAAAAIASVLESLNASLAGAIDRLDKERAKYDRLAASVIAAAVKALTPAIGAEAATAAINAIIAGDVPRVAIQF
jgi:hypothetical protein